MRQRAKQGGIRPLIAVIVAIAFVFAPVAGLAQNNGGEQAKDAEGEEAAQGENGDGEGSEEAAEAKKPAGPTPKLFLLPVQGVRDTVSSIIPERVGEMLRSQVKGKSQVELLPTYDKLQKAGGGRANAAVAEAERLYTSGIGLLTAGEDKKASTTFQQAVDIMEQNIADLTNFDVLSDAYKNLALAYFNAGFDFDGRKKMKVFAHLEPAAKLDPEKFPKELRAVFNDEAKKIKKGGPGKLVVKADVEEALIYIDGEAKGKIPATIEDVGYGYHYMVVRAPNGSVWAEQIRVRGRGKKQDFEVELGQGGAQAAEDAEQEESGKPAFYTGLVSTIKSGKFGRDLQPYLEELTTRTGAQYVAWVAMVRDGMEYKASPFVYRASDGMMVRAEGVAFNIQLSNLRVGVSDLATQIATTVETMPEDKAFTEVALGQPKKVEQPDEGDDTQDTDTGDTSDAVASAEDTGDEAEEQAGDEVDDPAEVAQADTDPDDDEGEAVVPPPDPSDQEGETDKWVWVGAGAGALLLTGIVVGGIALTSGGGDQGPEGFDAQLTW